MRPPTHAAPSAGSVFFPIRKPLFAAGAVLLSACLAYQPPSGRGYDYDRGRAVARSDIRSERLVYFASGAEADSLAASSNKIEANCGFSVTLAYPGAARDRHAAEFAQGYNSVSVPVIEQRLGFSIAELLQRCAEPGIGDN